MEATTTLEPHTAPEVAPPPSPSATLSFLDDLGGLGQLGFGTLGAILRGRIDFQNLGEQIDRIGTSSITITVLTAIFSSMPHTGKLKALICIATPSRGTMICWPMNVLFLESFAVSPST